MPRFHLVAVFRRMGFLPVRCIREPRYARRPNGFLVPNRKDGALEREVAGTGWSEREGRKDGNGRSQAFEVEWLGGGLGWGASKF
jgi:hypothetical protein